MGTEVRIPKLLSVKELAAATGLPVWRVRELCAQGKMPFLRIGKTYRFAEDAIAKWIEQQTKTEAP
jgi:excisionase family DNA binding protein